jgi:hypothetical protein
MTRIHSVGAGLAVAVLALIPVQVIAYIAWPPPDSVIGHFQRYSDSMLRGMAGLDLLYVVTNALMIPLVITLFFVVRDRAEVLASFALVFALVGYAAYFPTNPAIEMGSLAAGYVDADPADRAVWIAAAEALLSGYEGMAFAVSYVLNGVALILFSAAMRRTARFRAITVMSGFASGVLGLVPSNAGWLGYLFSFLSLLPLTVWLAWLAIDLRRLSAQRPVDLSSRKPTSAHGPPG